MYALRERRVHVTQEDFEMAVAKVMQKDSEKNMSIKKLWKWLLYPFYFESNGPILDETSSHSLGKQSTKNQKQKFRKLTIIQIHWKNMAVIPKAFFSFSFHKIEYFWTCSTFETPKPIKPSPRCHYLFPSSLLIKWYPWRKKWCTDGFSKRSLCQYKEIRVR